MAQPKLSNKSIQQLLAIGPLSGLDATTDPYWLDSGYVTDSVNFVPNHAYQGLSPIRGRIPGTQQVHNKHDTVTSLCIYYPANNPASLIAVTTKGLFYQANTQQQSAGWANLPVPSAPNGDKITSNPGMFARYARWLYFTNQDPNGICYKFDHAYDATFWGIEFPPSAPTEQTTSPSGGMIYGNNYYYRYTYKADNQSDPFLHQESSPSPPAGPFNIGTTLGPPSSNTASVSQTPAPTVAINTSGGTIPPGTYYVGTTWVTGAGEEGISTTTTVSPTAGASEFVITPQSPPAGATGWNIYTGTTPGQLTQQGATRSGTGTATEFNYTTTGPFPPGFTGTMLPPPLPQVNATSGGSLPARTEYYQLTYVNGTGETVPSPEASINLQAGQLAVVASPPTQANATGYNVYGSTTSAQEVLQNSSPISLGTSWTEPNAGLTLGQSAVLTAIPSPDPQVNKINFYRIGGQSLGNWYFVGSTKNTSGTFTDNVPDSAITGQALVLARDPPAPFVAIFPHVERIFGFGYPGYTDFNGNFHASRPADLWYSNYNEPWGFDGTNQVIPVGDQDYGDIAVSGGSLSSIGILWKTKTTWALYGQSPSDFFVTKLFDVGAVATAACIIALGVAFWLSQQGIYMFDGATLTYLSKPVKAILDGFSQADMAACTACFDDRMVWFSFPTQNVSLGYDTVNKNWWKASLYSPLFAFDTEAQSRPTAPDYVFGVDPATMTFVDQWFAATTDYDAPIISTLKTRIGGAGAQIGTMRVRYIELIGSANISATDSVTVTITANPASTNRSFSKKFTTSAVNLRQRASVPPGIQGDMLQLQISAQSSDLLVLEGAAAHGWLRRLYNIVA